MAHTEKTTNFAEIASGFMSGLNSLGPLIRGYVESQEEGAPPSMLLHLTNPEKKIHVDPMKDPMVEQVNGGEPDTNFFAAMDAEMFHYIVWGRLPFARAINEKVVLMESRQAVPPEDQPGAGMAGGPLIFNNLLYEMYLIRIGAQDLITENTKPEIPLPGEKRPIKEIPLLKVPEKTLLGALANAMARVTGWLLGFLLRFFIKLLKREEDLEAPLEYSEVPQPRPPNPPASSGARLKIMKFLFRRIDVFSVIENLAKGIMATGPFKQRR
jgi:hypothetical protein